MFSRKFISHGLLVISILFIGSTLGCDQISAFKEYFSPSEDQNQTQQATSSPAQTSQTTAQKPAAPSPDAPLSANTLARVGNWSITIEEFNDRLAKLKEVVPDFDINDIEAKRLVLEELVRQQLLVIEAEQTGLAQRKDIVDTVEEFRRTLLVRGVAAKLTEDVDVTDLEAQEYYNENKDLLVDPVTWRVREIVANTQVGAKEILIELLKGADFAQMAKDRSVSKSAAKGGDIGEISQPPFAQMENALRTLEVGAISSVFKGPDGFYIVKLEDKKGGEQKSYSEVKDDIITGLTLLKQQEAIIIRLNELREKTPIKVNENLLE